MLHRQDVGHRVVIRRLAGTRDGRPLFSDVLGQLIDLSETHVTVTTATGTLQVPLAEIHRAKRVPPPRRPATRDTIALEHAANEAWPAPVQDRLGDWLLRAGGQSDQTNSALPIGDPGRPLDAAIAAVARWYAERGQRPLMTVPLPLAAPVDAALSERGWTAGPRTLVQTASLAAIPDPSRPDLPPVTVSSAPSDAWLALTATHTATPLPAEAEHPLTPGSRLRYAHAYADTGALVGIAQGVITGGGRWLGIAMLEVVPAARRHGVARRIVGALAAWAREEGARDVFVHVAEDNVAAVELSRRLGFRTHHRRRTRAAPAAGSDR